MEDIRKGICPLCHHNEILEAEAIEFSGQHHRPYIRALTYANTGPRKLLGMKVDDGVQEVWEPRGALLAYACRRCGFTQWFTKAPETVPIGPEHKTRLIRGGEPEGPYR